MTFIERKIREQSQATYHIVRAANRKTLQEIHAEIRNAQAASLATPRELADMRLAKLLPSWLRRVLLSAVSRRPTVWKKHGGTVAVTAVGMFGKDTSGWGIPLTLNTLDVTIGGIATKPAVVDGQIAIREMLSLTVSVDHDVVDGAPVARFAARLKQLIETAYSLPTDGVQASPMKSAA